MAKKFNELREKMSPESQGRARLKANVMMKKLMLAELRQALELSQEDMANAMNLKQPAISKIEKNTDMFISTLRRYIEAMGGELDISAKFDDREFHINLFEDLQKDELKERVT